MSVTAITSVTVTSVQALNGRAATASERPASETTEPPRDRVTGELLPPRFPWLSRITRELERASNQTPAYEPAPLIGENLDRSV